VVKVEIMRMDTKGACLHFTEVDLDSFIHLGNIVHHNTGADLLEREWFGAAPKT
jgi:hypothetical protein